MSGRCSREIARGSYGVQLLQVQLQIFVGVVIVGVVRMWLVVLMGRMGHASLEAVGKERGVEGREGKGDRAGSLSGDSCREPSSNLYIIFLFCCLGCMYTRMVSTWVHAWALRKTPDVQQRATGTGMRHSMGERVRATVTVTQYVSSPVFTILLSSLFF